MMYVKNVKEAVAVDEYISKLPAKAYQGFSLTDIEAVGYTGEIVDFSMHKMNKPMQQNQIREALMKGYVEMSHINLSICNECLHAEYEADHMVERLVSGG